MLDNPKSHSLRCKQLSLQTVDFKAKRFSMSASVTGGEVGLYWCKGSSNISYSIIVHTQLIKTNIPFIYIYIPEVLSVFLQVLSICGQVELLE